MIFNKMQAAIQPHLLNKIYHHPFNVALCNGTLPLHTYQRFLEQDRLYLYDFSVALQCIANRMDNPEHQRLFSQLAREALKTQQNLHNKYLLKTEASLFFKPIHLPTKKIPIVSRYTEYLLKTTQCSRPEVAVASVIPCFYLYSNLGLHMKSQMKDSNPYRLWIESYSDKRFLQSNELIIQVINFLGRDLGRIEEKNTIEAFVQSTAFEVAFWDSIYTTRTENRNKKPTEPMDLPTFR